MEPSWKPPYLSSQAPPRYHTCSIFKPGIFFLTVYCQHFTRPHPPLSTTYACPRHSEYMLFLWSTLNCLQAYPLKMIRHMWLGKELCNRPWLMPNGKELTSWPTHPPQIYQFRKTALNPILSVQDTIRDTQNVSNKPRIAAGGVTTHVFFQPTRLP